jgi:hypothetical protein
MTDINALHSSLLAADEAADVAALAAVAWQIYGQRQRRPPIWARCGPGSGFMRPHGARAAGGWPHEEPRPTPARRLRSRQLATPEMPVTMRKLTAAAPVPPGTAEPLAPRAGRSRNRASQGNGCLPAAPER